MSTPARRWSVARLLVNLLLALLLGILAAIFHPAVTRHRLASGPCSAHRTPSEALCRHSPPSPPPPKERSPLTHHQRSRRSPGQDIDEWTICDGGGGGAVQGGGALEQGRMGISGLLKPVASCAKAAHRVLATGCSLFIRHFSLRSGFLAAREFESKNC